MIQPRNPIEQLAEDFFARRRRGEAISVEAFADAHPEHADRIRSLFPTLELLESGGEPLRHPIPAPLRRLGDYEILREIGRGGMGVVYEARQKSLGREVALKVLPPHAALDARFRERFRQEAEAAARLQHPNIVPVYNVGEEDGIAYFAMQYIDGLGLDRILDEIREWRGGGSTGEAPTLYTSITSTLLTGSDPAASGTSASTTATGVAPPSTARSDASTGNGSHQRYHRSVARIGQVVAEALAHAHRGGVLHRDIKPSNLIVDRTGRAWVADFGLCKTDESGALTQSGELAGSFRYMAPERFNGESDARSDVYGLGVTLYEMLTLRPAFEGTNRARTMKLVTDGTPVRPRKVDRTIPPDLETIVLKAMDRFPEARYETAGAMAQDLASFLAARPVKARRPTLGYLLWLAAKRNRRVAGTIVVAAVILVAASIVFVIGLDGARRDAIKAGHESDRQRETASFQSTVANIAAADSALRLNEIRAARRHLEAVPPDRRFWEWRHLTTRLDRSTRTIAETQVVAGVAFDPTGRLLASSGDRCVRIWEAATGTCVTTLRGHRGATYSVAFGPEGRRLVSSGSTDRTARIWNVETGQIEHVLRGHSDEVARVAFSPGGRHVATGSHDFTARLWATSTGRTVRTFQGHTHSVTGVSFSPDAASLATASWDRTVRLWNVADGSVRRVLRGHEDVVVHVAFSPDGARIASCARDGKIRVWDPATGRTLGVLHGHTEKVARIAFLPGGERLASVSRDRTLRIWDVVAGREIAVLQGHQDMIESVAAHPDGRRIATGSWARTIKLWDLGAPAPVTVLRGHLGPVTALRFDSTGERLLSGSTDATVRLWDPVAAEECAAAVGHSRAIEAVAFSADGQRLLSASHDGTVRSWSDAGEALEVHRDHDGRVSGIAVCPATGAVASAGYGGIVKIRDASNGEAVSEIRTDAPRLIRLAWRPDGARLATAHGDGKIRLWDRATGRLVRALDGHKGSVSSLAYSPDGNRLASGGRDSLIRIWDPVRGEELARLEGHVGQVRSLAFHPIEPRLVSGGTNDQSIIVWDVERFVPMLTLRGQAGWVYGVAFTPNGRHLASAASNRTIRIWHGDAPVIHAESRERAQRARNAESRRARTRAGSPAAIDAWCWDTVKRPGASREELCRVRTWAKMLDESGGESRRHLVARALAWTRLADLPRARAEFDRAIGSETGISGELRAVCLAFLAAIHERDGSAEARRHASEQLNVVLRGLEPSDEIGALLAEADELTRRGELTPVTSPPPAK